ncbi:hypothetical protein APTSU1_001566800 [Apodemus speciosus]|uniref:Uncharacterized protein n=1 Tax=Apodemus speciosus TaxID=105296 RepID=A0ABQ0FMN5_APOSI
MAIGDRSSSTARAQGFLGSLGNKADASLTRQQPGNVLPQERISTHR